MGKLQLGSEASILSGGRVRPSRRTRAKSGDSILIKRVLGLTDAPRMPMGPTPYPTPT